MCEKIKDCTYCKNVMPCKAESKSLDMVICEKFFNFFPEEEGVMSLEALQAMRDSIPEDPIEPDYSGIEVDKEIPLAVGYKLVLAQGVVTIVGIMATGVAVEVDKHPGNPQFVSFQEIYA